MKLLLRLFIVILFPCSTLQAMEALIFSKPGPTDHIANISEIVLRKAYERIGVKIDTHYFPAERALYMSNSGLVDGEVNRIIGLEKKYPNLIRVPVAGVITESGV